MEKNQCTHCDGLGHCLSCDGFGRPGRGRFECSACNGTGRCSECDGYGHSYSSSEKEVRMKSMSEKLKAAKRRNPDAYKIIGVVSGFGEKKIREIAEGKEPSSTEKIILEGLSTME